MDVHRTYTEEIIKLNHEFRKEEKKRKIKEADIKGMNRNWKGLSRTGLVGESRLATYAPMKGNRRKLVSWQPVRIVSK